MLKNYLRVAYRNLIRSKLYTVISVVGLAAGTACCILIFLYVQKSCLTTDSTSIQMTSTG